MNRDHDDISGILIPSRDRTLRQQVTDTYVPFEPPQAPGADSIHTESMLGLVVIAVIAIAVTAYLVYRYWQSSVMMLALVGAN